MPKDHLNGLPYCVAFDTRNAAGLVRAVKVTIEITTIDAAESARLDLRDHPLMPYLQRYVLDNLTDRPIPSLMPAR